MIPLLPIFQSLLKPVSTMYSAHQERKQAAKTGKQKIQEAQIDADNTLNLTVAEWEATNVSNQPSTWKDEYVTVIVTLPIPLLLLGAILQAYNPSYGDLLTGTVEGIKAINNLEGTMAGMMETVVLAAVGIKVWRSR